MTKTLQKESGHEDTNFVTAEPPNAKTHTETSSWDSARHLKTREDMALYLEACLEENDPALATHALGVIARAKGMSNLARETGLSREGLYKALAADGNPEFVTVMKVVNALGLQLHATQTQQSKLGS